MAKKIRKRAILKCPSCQAGIPGRKISLCAKCKTIMELGEKFKGLGLEFLWNFKEAVNLEGFAEFRIYFDPLFLISNFPEKSSPKAICLNGTWYARLDKGHALHAHFDAEAQRLREL